jgi:SAM-dependent methyltransferase
MGEWFAEWFDSPYYHLLYRHRSEEEAGGFVEALQRKLQLAKGSSVLELACGKGRHAKAFAAMGMDVCGADLSAESIAAAARDEAPNLHFFVHDMRKPFRHRYFDLVTNLFTSFGYFRSEHDHVLAARSIAGALKPGGLFVMDFVNRAPAIRHNAAHAEEVIEREGVRFLIHRSSNHTHLLKDIRIEDGETRLHYTERVHHFGLEELKQLFEAQGLTLWDSAGTYDLQPYDADTSPRMILFFRN